MICWSAPDIHVQRFGQLAVRHDRQEDGRGTHYLVTRRLQDLVERALELLLGCPGWVDTGINDPQFLHDNLSENDVARLIERTVPMDRQGLLEEMAAAVAFLASSDASYITGQTLLVDGGLLSHV